MGASEVLIIVGFLAAYLSVRFGIPLAVCWLIGRVDRRYLHPSA